MKAVITCGGFGTRLLPFTKELPKEMAPIFHRTKSHIEMVPLIQFIYEQLYEIGAREFCFITGKTKRSIENHFTPDEEISKFENLRLFYEKITNSKIFWTTQNKTKGFGDAVKYAETFTGSEKFILQAGDVALFPKENTEIIKKMIKISEIENNVDAVLLISKVNEPERHGIVEIGKKSESDEYFRILNVVEKPSKPKSNLGIMPIYLFNKSIFSALSQTKVGVNNELQLTDAIQVLINSNKKILACHIDYESIIDVGTPESYWNALNNSYKK